MIFNKLLRFEDTPMQGNVLIMCKLLILLLLYHGLFSKIGDPFVPFVQWLDIFNTIPGFFELCLKIIFIVATTLLFFNYWVRTSSFLLGCVVILTILASRTAYYNHKLICGCALLLAGLTNKNQLPYFIILQFVILYIGASFNKILDTDWWSGAFMHNWLLNARENVFYTNISQLLPDMFLAKAMSYMAFTTEFLIGIMLLIKRYRNFAVWFIIVFHTLLFTIITIRFGHFLESIAIILLAFLNWPKKKMIIDFNPEKLKVFRKVISFFDFDKKIIWQHRTGEEDFAIKLKKDGETVKGLQAVKDIVLYTPFFYVLLFVSDLIIREVFLFNWKYLFTINAILVWALILFFSPISNKIFSRI